MTDIDPKALEHACQCAGRSVHHFDRMALDLPLRASIVAHARAIEQHEAFKREVSDAVEDLRREWPEVRSHIVSRLSVFIIPKPDPLVEAMSEAMCGVPGEDYTQPAKDLRAALAARGLEVRKIGEGE